MALLQSSPILEGTPAVYPGAFQDHGSTYIKIFVVIVFAYRVLRSTHTGFLIFFIPGLVNSWPAVQLWKSTERLTDLIGASVVPVMYSSDSNRGFIGDMSELTLVDMPFQMFWREQEVGVSCASPHLPTPLHTCRSAAIIDTSQSVVNSYI